MKKKNFMKVAAVFAVLFTFLFGMASPKQASAAETYSLDAAKSGIVEIFVGITDQNDDFYRVKNTSGCLVCNSDSNTYVVTAYHSVTLSDQEEADACALYGISTDSYGVSDSIQIVVKGDVMAEMNIEATSETKDFCILSTQEVISEKTALRLGSSEDLPNGTRVFALGFADDVAEQSYAQYDSSEVISREGELLSDHFGLNGITLLKHTAKISAGNSGGALVDEDGYLLGLNYLYSSEDGGEGYFSLPVEEIAQILDNYEISYDSRTLDEARETFTQTYADCTELYEDGNYTRETKEVLETALESAADLAEDGAGDAETYTEATGLLEDARDQLEEKISKTHMLMILLGIVILLLAVLLVRQMMLMKKLEQALLQRTQRDSEQPAGRVRKREPERTRKERGRNDRDSGRRSAGRSESFERNRNDQGSGNVSGNRSESFERDRNDRRSGNISGNRSEPYGRDWNEREYGGMSGEYPESRDRGRMEPKSYGDAGNRAARDPYGNYGERTVQNQYGDYGNRMDAGGRNRNEPIASSVYESVYRGGGRDEGTIPMTETPVDYGQPRRAVPYLIQAKNNRRIPITKDGFALGRHPDLADYVISDNAVIGRRHAIIRSGNGRYWISDLESYNGTFVNGIKIDRNGAVLHDGDEIRLANEVFYFKQG